MQFLTLIKI